MQTEKPNPSRARHGVRHTVLRAAICACALASAALPATAATWNPDPSLGNPDQHRRLYEIGRHYAEVNFDPDADLVGSQSHHPPNKKQHATRESAYYAYGLLLTGDPADRERAQKILRRVVATQDTQSQGPTRGAFGWYAEEKPQDLNSAAFVGVTLADAAELDRRHPCLDPDVRQQVDAAGRMAVEAVMHRDVDPAYTNIALLSTGLAAAGAKLWDVPGAAKFAETKLDAVLKMAGDNEFAEYLSPTYYAVSLDGAYQAKKFAFSPEFAAKADDAVDRLWRRVAASYHAPTYQLAGPYMRAYGDDMLEYAAGLKYLLYLALDGNYPLPDTDTDHEWDKGGLMALADLPIGPRPEFKQTPPAWREFTVTGAPTTPVRTLRQYRDGNFVLGTVAFQDEWKQKRNLVAHWRTNGPTPDQFRIGFCIDESNETLPAGVPPDRIHFYSQQVKDAALVAQVASTVIPGVPGCAALVFDKDAKVAGPTDGSPVRVEDGAMRIYVYPVSTGPVAYQTQADAHAVHLTRSWATADAVGDLRVLSYLVVFRPADASPPVVTGLELQPEAGGGHVAAKVDGADLSLSFKN